MGILQVSWRIPLYSHVTRMLPARSLQVRRFTLLVPAWAVFPRCSAIFFLLCLLHPTFSSSAGSSSRGLASNWQDVARRTEKSTCRPNAHFISARVRQHCATVGKQSYRAPRGAIIHWSAVYWRFLNVEKLDHGSIKELDMSYCHNFFVFGCSSTHTGSNKGFDSLSK